MGGTKLKNQSYFYILSQLFTTLYPCPIKSLPCLELKKQTSIIVLENIEIMTKTIFKEHLISVSFTDEDVSYT
jgi:hypothetical protein